MKCADNIYTLEFLNHEMLHTTEGIKSEYFNAANKYGPQDIQ